ncbi:MAG: endonuclease/exonuclease/phosphatase family protein, partial [Bacteroidota bacterium]
AMKRIPLLFICILGSLITLSQEITVATFNVEFLNESRVHLKFGMPFDISTASKKDQKFWNKEENRKAKLAEASANVAQMIKQIDADIITLTEAGDADDIQVLVNELSEIGVNYDNWQVCDCSDTFTGQHVAVLSKFPLKETWPQITGRSIYLEETDGDAEGETGISKGLKVTASIDDKDVDIFVFHFKSERGGYDSDAKRLAQASIARRAIIKQLNQGRPVIVTGDLNSEKRSESIYRIRGFHDIYEELIQTGHSDYFENMDVRWTYNYKGEPEQIDHILISPGLASKSDIKTSILETNDANISEHNPVIVKLKIR